jgi:nuclear pore complex protein Nup155
VLSLWKVLSEHQLNIIVQELPKEQPQSLYICAFRDLALYRKDLCVLLIISLINTYLNDNGSIDAISSKLRDVCPNLYRQEDAVSHKATEMVLLSKSCTDIEEKERKLLTALQLCKSAAPNLPLNNICQQFTAVGFYQGVVELCVVVANKVDPTGAALHFYRNNNEPNEDQIGYAAYENRLKCYNEVKKTLEYIYQTVYNTEGVSQTSRYQTINNEVLEVVYLALQSQDYLLHMAVYEYLLSHNLLLELLGITEKSLGEFLRRSALRNPQNLQLVDLLWKYYERNNEHSEAAKILDDLATKSKYVYFLISITFDWFCNMPSIFSVMIYP